MILSNLVHRLRQFRSLHHWVGIAIVLFMTITSVTGLLLGWKKNVDLLQPPPHKGASTDVADWVSYEQVVPTANRALDSVRHEQSGIERIEGGDGDDEAGGAAEEGGHARASLHDACQPKNVPISRRMRTSAPRSRPLRATSALAPTTAGLQRGSREPLDR